MSRLGLEPHSPEQGFPYSVGTAVCGLVAQEDMSESGLARIPARAELRADSGLIGDPETIAPGSGLIQGSAQG